MLTDHTEENGMTGPVVWRADGAPIKAWIRGVEVESSLYEQARKLSTLPFLYKHVALMPDVHMGKGCSIGTVLATKGAVVPAAVGVDVGCGMQAVRTSITAQELPDSLRGVRDAIEGAVPVGNGPGGSWRTDTFRPGTVDRRWAAAHKESLRKLLLLDPELERSVEDARVVNQLGTLGGGNHFIEICLDENDCVWLMLHSGSRGIGNKIATHYIGKARAEMERWKIALPDRDLSYLPEGTEYFNRYILAIAWLQDYARANRDVMMTHIKTAVAAALERTFTTDFQVDCHHNYLAREMHFGESVLVTRKGAVRAGAGDLGIIPGSMGQKSYVVEGLGNPDSFESCSHGAGRRMSRTVGKASITLERHAEVTAGVECRKDAGVLDESLDNYKAIDAVMAAQADLVRPLHTLRAVVCVKG